MTEKEFYELAEDLDCVIENNLEYVFKISNDVETCEFLTGKKDFIEACKEMSVIASEYKVEQVVSNDIKSCPLPEVYINVSYLREQTKQIKDKLMSLKSLIDVYLDGMSCIKQD